MLARRSILSLAAASLLACGGGGGAATVALYGDSLAHGSTPAGRLATTPAQRLAELADVEVHDYTMPAETLREAFGEAVPYADGVLMSDRLPHSVFPGHFAQRPADIVVLRFGGADYLLGTPLARFAELYMRAVYHARLAGCTPILAGLYDHPGHPGMADFDAAAARVAADAGATWVDLRALVPVAYPGDLVDGLHGTQETSDRWMAAIADAVKALA